jgi:hypothetical protein
MIDSTRWSGRKALLVLFAALALALSDGVPGLNGAWAQGSGAPVGPPAVSPLSPTAPPEIVKPAVPPSEVNNADAVFRKLDASNRGYVTPEDTKDLIGFGAAFKAADTGRSGKLTLAQFKKAWAIYKAKK